MKWVKIALEEGVDASIGTLNGLADGMIEAGEKYNRNEYFVRELLMYANGLYVGVGILKPSIEVSGRKSEIKGSIVLGVVEGTFTRHMSSSMGSEKLELQLLFWHRSKEQK